MSEKATNRTASVIKRYEVIKRFPIYYLNCLPNSLSLSGAAKQEPLLLWWPMHGLKTNWRFPLHATPLIWHLNTLFCFRVIQLLELFFCCCQRLHHYNKSSSYIYSCPYLNDKLSVTIPIVGAFLFFFVVCVLFRTACTDPGIIPRTEKDEVIYNERQALIASQYLFESYLKKILF